MARDPPVYHQQLAVGGRRRHSISAPKPCLPSPHNRLKCSVSQASPQQWEPSAFEILGFVLDTVIRLSFQGPKQWPHVGMTLGSH